MLKLLSGMMLLLSLPVFAQSNDTSQEPNDENGVVRYITDDLYTFLHAGPGRNYRILGSVIAGAKVTELQVDEENNFVEIIDDKQRTGWVDARFIANSPSIRDLVPSLRQQVENRTTELEAQRQETERLNQQIQDLNSQNSELQSQIGDFQQRYQSVQRELDTKDESANQEWFIRGAIVALGGILLGIIITYLPKKRRRGDQWM